MELKKKEINAKQQHWLQEELRARAARGETGFSAQMGAATAMYSRVQVYSITCTAACRSTLFSRAASLPCSGSTPKVASLITTFT